MGSQLRNFAKQTRKQLAKTWAKGAIKHKRHPNEKLGWRLYDNELLVKPHPASSRKAGLSSRPVSP